ncbi:hypothetical protein [Holospora undulata]|uniref:Uncharacterized protein n=1 Tax=Holospora undulata HU1 TaxID=1321371 RepID=A0A061JGX9_9PROT|nr:hypothetical protein [Holospora undulata]ETZ05411.1 hypothetical protein K737_300149 [Holospora undulata HU1]
MKVMGLVLIKLLAERFSGSAWGCVRDFYRGNFCALEKSLARISLTPKRLVRSYLWVSGYSSKSFLSVSISILVVGFITFYFQDYILTPASDTR